MAATANAIANLLRLARTECRGSVAFAVVAVNGDQHEVFRVPPQNGGETPSDEVLAELASRASLDPEFGHARTFVRTVQVPSATILAVAPVPGPRSAGVVGVLGEDPNGFGPPQLELLDRLAGRIARHLEAVHTLARPGADPGKADVPPQSAGDVFAPAPPDPPGWPAAPGVAPVAVPPEAAASAPGQTSEHPLGLDEPPAPGGGGEARIEARMPPLLGFAGFTNEPAGVITPTGPGPFEPAAWHRQPFGPQTLSSTGGLLRPAVGHEPAPASASIQVGSSDPAAEPRSTEPPAPGAWWSATDPVTGLPSLGQFFSRAGRLLGSEARASGAVALVLVEVPEERTAPAAARALAAQLRFSDPLARVDRDLFAVAVLLFPGSTRGDAVEERLGSAVRSALDWLAPVRTTHVLAEPGDRRDVDELLRQAMAGLPGRTLAGSSR